MKGTFGVALRPKSPPPGKTRQQQRNEDEQQVFMREVDEALRQDQLTDFWEKYGKLTIGLVVLFIVALGGWFYYQHRVNLDAQADGETMVKALDDIERGDSKGAQVGFGDLTSSDHPGYRAASEMMLAGNAAKNGNLANAAERFGKVAEDSSLPKPYRDAALIRQTMAEFDTLKPEIVVERLKPMAVPGDPWFGSAGEMVAIAYMKMGKNDLAGPLFAQISREEDVPDTIRRRARQLAGLMGVDAIDNVEAVANAGGAPVTGQGGQ